MIWTMIVLVNAWTIVFFFANLLQCYPISVNWTGWGAAVDSCINSNAMLLAQAWSDVLTDGNVPYPDSGRLDADTMNSHDPFVTITKCGVFCRFLISTLMVPQIWRLQMPRPRKIAVSSVFLLGTL